MKLNEIQGYFNNLLTSLKLKEHPNSFGRNNIPANLIDHSYALDFRDMRINTANQRATTFRVPITISVYFKDYKTDASLRTYALTKAEEILGLLLSPLRAYKDGGFSVQPTGLRIDPFSQANQACAIMSLDFDITLFYQF